MQYKTSSERGAVELVEGSILYPFLILCTFLLLFLLVYVIFVIQSQAACKAQADREAQIWKQEENRVLAEEDPLIQWKNRPYRYFFQSHERKGMLFPYTEIEGSQSLFLFGDQISFRNQARTPVSDPADFIRFVPYFHLATDVLFQKIQEFLNEVPE